VEDRLAETGSREAFRSVGGLIGVALVLALTGCVSALAASPTPTPRPPTSRGPDVRLTPAPGVAGDPEAGRRLFVATGCGGCHTLPGVAGANGVAGPILANVVLRPTLAGETIPMSPDTLTRWLLDPAALKPGTSMPSVGLTEAEARDVTAYLYSLPRTPFP
jgi:cytochrome c